VAWRRDIATAGCPGSGTENGADAAPNPSTSEGLPVIEIDGHPIRPESPHQFRKQEGQLIMQVQKDVPIPVLAQDNPLPQFEMMRAQLPAPICDDHPLWIETYWKAWELAFKNFYDPTPENGFVSRYIDAAFNENIFLWDTCFMTMFCNCAHPLVPGIGSLDNFYAKQHDTGEISREISRITGLDYADWINREGQGLFTRWGWDAGEHARADRTSAPVIYQGREAPEPPPRLTLDALDHPILTWSEWESFRVTGDIGRLGTIFDPLVRYYGALQKYLRQGNGLYITDWASMDNSPRNPFLKDGGTGIDISSEMVLFARQMSEIAALLGKPEEARQFSQEADALAGIINAKMWDEQRQFYFDLDVSGNRVPVKTVAGFWPLLARIASREKAHALANELNNPATFARTNRVPTLAANEPRYESNGGYWRGAVWAPTNTMVIRGLENYGHDELARSIALEHLELVARVFKTTGTIWENYSPEAVAPGQPARGDFVGWSGIGPILYLLEYGIGLKPDASKNQLVWNLCPGGRRGCERFRFNGHVVSLLAEPASGEPDTLRIAVESDAAFTLQINFNGKQRDFQIRTGSQELVFPKS
jgi:hypothetical protein